MSILQRTADAEVAIENARRLERDGKGYDGRLPDGGRSAETTAALIVAAFAHGDVGRMAAAARRALERDLDDAGLDELVEVEGGHGAWDLQRHRGLVPGDPPVALGQEPVQVATQRLIQRGDAADAPLEVGCWLHHTAILKHRCVDETASSF